jgi:SAM-dependent methyltransferase
MNLLNALQDVRPNPIVSSRDGMVTEGRENEYYELGRRALDLIVFGARLTGKESFASILDLPCGHGRVLRWLRAFYPGAQISACDLDKDGVDFCVNHFDAQGLYSNPDLRSLSLKARFDLIWCGSLLTHLPETQWRQTLDCLCDWVQECGVVVFSTQGRYMASLIARQEADFADNLDTGSLLRDYHANGRAFQPYFENAAGNYGLSLIAPDFLLQHLRARSDVIISSYLEAAWGVQDIVILYKKDGYFVGG